LDALLGRAEETSVQPRPEDEMHPYTVLKLAEGHAAGLEREAHRNSLAKAVAESRRDERRNFLRRMWQKRHAQYPHFKTRTSRKPFPLRASR
jgi:hypothetical protein